MSYDDDEETKQALSTARALERADHGKAERKERQQKKSLFGLLLTVIGKNLFRQTRKIADETMRERDRAFKTLTHKQSEKKDMQTAQSQSDPDQMVEASKRQEAMENQAQYEEDQ